MKPNNKEKLRALLNLNFTCLPAPATNVTVEKVDYADLAETERLIRKAIERQRQEDFDAMLAGEEEQAAEDFFVGPND